MKANNMKYVNYYAPDVKYTRAILLCKGADSENLLYLPPKSSGEVPCLVIAAPNAKGLYKEGAWMNVGFKEFKEAQAIMKEIILCRGKLPQEDKYQLYLRLDEYQLYLRLKQKFEN